MDWMYLVLRLPVLLSLVAAMVYCLTQIRKYPFPATLAAAGFGIALLQSLLLQSAYSVVYMVINDQIAYWLVMAADSLASAVYIALLATAVFAARRTTDSPAQSHPATSSDNQPSMSVANPNEAIAFAKQLFKKGATYEQIEERLVERGLEPENVELTIEAVQRSASQVSGWKSLVLGGLLCGLGLLGTLITLTVAVASVDNRRHIINAGIFVVGVGLMIRGVVKITK